MDDNKKKVLLKNIAKNAYNIGFGARKSFKSYDILCLIPRMFSVITICIGVIQFTNIYKGYFESINDFISALLIVIGIIALVTDIRSDNKEEYEKSGVALTKNFNTLSDMYDNVLNDVSDIKLNEIEVKLEEIKNEALSNSLSKQILFSGWWAHFSFFYEIQVDWICNELDLKFFKDKIPASFKLFIFLVVIFLLWIA